MFLRLLRRAFPAAAALLLLGAGLAARDEVPPAPDRWATDKAGFLSPSAVESLDIELERYQEKTGHQVLVYIDRTTAGIPLEDWASRAFQAWRVGRKGLDDGLVLFVMAEDRKIRIEVGYGLEAVVPDITAGRVINDIILPSVRNGDNDRAVRDGVAALFSVISGEPGTGTPPEGARTRATRRFSAGEMILAAAAVIFFLILFITNPSLAFWLLINILSGGRGGGGGSGRGSFHGGGGRSGGGGASGSW